MYIATLSEWYIIIHYKRKTHIFILFHKIIFLPCKDLFCRLLIILAHFPFLISILRVIVSFNFYLSKGKYMKRNIQNLFNKFDVRKRNNTVSESVIHFYTPASRDFPPEYDGNVTNLIKLIAYCTPLPSPVNAIRPHECASRYVCVFACVYALM